MPRKSRESFINDEHKLQIQEGRRLAAKERINDFDEADIHEKTRATLHAASQAAAETLLDAATGNDVPMKSIHASFGILDRTGHPPTRKIQNENVKSSKQMSEALSDVFKIISSMPEEMKDAIVEALRPTKKREAITVEFVEGSSDRQLGDGRDREINRREQEIIDCVEQET